MIVQTLSRDEISGMLTSFAHVARMFIEQEDDKLFGLGLAIKASIESGLPKDSVLEVAGTETGRSKKKINQLYTVATVFGERRWQDFDWMTHVVAATAPGVNPDDLDTHHVAYEWMRTAVDGYDSKQGRKQIRRKHTARTLRRAIREASADAKPGKPETLLKTDATYISMDIVKDTVTLQVPSWVFVKLMGISSIIDQWEVSLTITRSQPQPASADAAKAVA